jgi:hypothetical protein
MTAVEWLTVEAMKLFTQAMAGTLNEDTLEDDVSTIITKAKEMEKEQRGYSEEDVIKIVEKSRETGLTAEYLLLTFKQQEQIN